MVAPAENWFIEFSSPHQAHMHAVDKYIYQGESSYQQIQIVDTYTFGRCLILDGKIQSSAFDEYIYHEVLVHPAMIVHQYPRRVLIIGGAEGAVTREVLKYPQVEEITMVDIDQKVVEICIKHLPTWHQNSFDDSRLEVFFADAREYLAKCEKNFDVIISDLTEPVDSGPSHLLFTREFYNILKKRLNGGGVLSLQAGSLSMALLDVHPPIRNTLRECFKVVRSYQTYIPCFDTLWGFILASADKDPLNWNAEKIEEELRGVEGELNFYDGIAHQGVFHLPKNLRETFDQDSRIIEDGNPFIVY